MSYADQIFIENCKDILENGTWAPMAAKTMKGILEGMKELRICDTVVTIKSALKEEDRPGMEKLAEELLAK